MQPYLWKTRADGVNIIDIGKTYSKIVLAARSAFPPPPNFLPSHDPN